MDLFQDLIEASILDVTGSFEAGPDTLNEKLGPAYSTTGNAPVDFFSSILRTTSLQEVAEKFVQSWNVDPELTLRLLRYTRSPKGKGLKDAGLLGMILVYLHDRDLFLKNQLELLGYTKDLWRMLQVLRELDVQIDSRFYLRPCAELLRHYVAKRSTMIAKWFPSENHHFSEFLPNIIMTLSDLVIRIPDEQLPPLLSERRVTKKIYRKLLSEMRAPLQLAETLLSQGLIQDQMPDQETLVKWFSRLPAVAHQKYKSLFENLDGDHPRIAEAYAIYKQHLEQKDSGAKVNTTGLDLVAIMEKYRHSSEVDTVYEAVWSGFLNRTPELDDWVYVMDNSGSMAGKPYMNAWAFGLLLCQKSTQDGYIVFSSRAEWVPVSKETTLLNLSQDTWKDVTGSTCFETAVDTLLERIARGQKPPRVVAVGSDGDLDPIENQHTVVTGYQYLVEQFQKKKLPVPLVLFLNFKSEKVTFQFLAQTPNAVYMGTDSVDGLIPVLEAVVECQREGREITSSAILKATLAKYPVEMGEYVPRLMTGDTGRAVECFRVLLSHRKDRDL